MLARSLTLTLAIPIVITMPSPAQDAAPDLRNRLRDETSPYLLQHAGNPVDWQPWSPEAFELARRLDRPIFLSIGYSTCYWCHVMERESFENEEIAALMNKLFVCIKVDREERPDVDEVYMSAVQLLNQGQGGWPMSVWLEPEGLRPFLGGTYFPAVAHPSLPAFPSVLRQVDELWRTRRTDVLRQAELVAEAVRGRIAAPSDAVTLGADVVQSGVRQLMAAYDETHGGFGRGRNKFPVPANIDFLMATAWDRDDVKRAVLHTLDRMALGGMYDQVGGGFHRYSTDEQWLVPHFEKMLYDNGQLASTYAEAARRTGDAFYDRVVREILEYVLREMTEPGGAFRSAQDAEVNHLEGGNYLWVPEEIRAALEAAGLPDDVDFALERYGLSGGTNFIDPHHPEAGRKNVLYLAARPDDWDRVDRIDAALLAARDQRDQPLTDDKVLTAWNGLMIAGFADGARQLGEARYLDAARRAARWLLEHHRAEDGSLLRTSRGGTARIDAFLEDYAFLIHGLVAIARSGEDAWALDAATVLAHTANARFRDDAAGGWYDTLADQSDLFVRVKTTYDGATPSGNGVMVLNAMELYDLTGDDAWLDDAVGALRGQSQTLATSPAGAIVATRALARAIPVVGDRLEAAGTSDDGHPRIGLEGPLHLDSEGRGRSVLHVAVPAGSHLTAHAPESEGVVPFEIAVDPPEDWTLDVTYPQGRLLEGPIGRLRVYEGDAAFDVRLQRRRDGAHAPTLIVHYQLCSETACQLPRTVPVSIAIEH